MKLLPPSVTRVSCLYLQVNPSSPCVAVAWVGTSKSGTVGKKKESFCTVGKIRERFLKGHQDTARIIASAHRTGGRVAGLDGRSLSSLLNSLEKGTLRDVHLL